METLLSLLSELKSKFLGLRGEQQDIDTIDSWIREAKRLLLLKSLKEHDGIKYIIEVFESEVILINQKLLDSDSKVLPDYERDRLIDRKVLAKKYLDLFTNLDEDLSTLEDRVDEELKKV